MYHLQESRISSIRQVDRISGLRRIMKSEREFREQFRPDCDYCTAKEGRD
jgi:hypothetical protein